MKLLGTDVRLYEILDSKDFIFTVYHDNKFPVFSYTKSNWLSVWKYSAYVGFNLVMFFTFGNYQTTYKENSEKSGFLGYAAVLPKFSLSCLKELTTRTYPKPNGYISHPLTIICINTLKSVCGITNYWNIEGIFQDRKS